MIDRGGIVWIGRREPENDANRWYFDALARLLAPAERLWRKRWPEEAARWDEWNVVALHGSYGAWRFVDFHRFEGLGEAIVPALAFTLRWELALDKMDPVRPDPVDPPVLHRSHLLFASPVKGRFAVDLRERVLRAYLAYDAAGIVEHPLAARRRGWEELCAREGLTLRNGLVVQASRSWDVRAPIPRPFARPSRRPTATSTSVPSTSTSLVRRPVASGPVAGVVVKPVSRRKPAEKPTPVASVATKPTRKSPT